MKILVLVAHPDDETIICGGTLDKLIQKGHEVFVTFYTNNDQAFFGKETQQMRIMRTKKEAILSSKTLGFKPKFLNFKDMQLEYDKGNLIQATIREIRRVKPDVIITHNANDKHIDHRTLGEIVPEANFQSGCNLCGGNITWTSELVIQGEVDLEMTGNFDFHVVSTISSNDLSKKIEAFKCYESIKTEHSTSDEWLVTRLKYLAEIRGKAAYVKYGEAFMINNYHPLNANSVNKLLSVLEL